MHPLEGLGIRNPKADESAANYDLFIKGRTKNQKIRDKLLKTQLAAWRSRMQAKGYYIGSGNTAWVDDKSGNPIKKGEFKPNLPKPGTESNLKTWKTKTTKPVKSSFENRISGNGASKENSISNKNELSVTGQKNEEVLNQLPPAKKRTTPGRSKTAATGSEKLLMGELKQLYGEDGFAESRGLAGTKRKLAIMRKEQELWRLQRPGEDFPSFTGRRVGGLKINGD